MLTCLENKIISSICREHVSAVSWRAHLHSTENKSSFYVVITFIAKCLCTVNSVCEHVASEQCVTKTKLYPAYTQNLVVAVVGKLETETCSWAAHTIWIKSCDRESRLKRIHLIRSADVMLKLHHRGNKQHTWIQTIAHDYIKWVILIPMPLKKTSNNEQ